jgi:solute carrier family 25 (mitochondrial carrier protein), member 16
VLFPPFRPLYTPGGVDTRPYLGTWSGAYRAGAQIYRDSGALGLFQGHSATLLRIFPYAAIKFMAYDQMHDVRIPLSPQDSFAFFIDSSL